MSRRLLIIANPIAGRGRGKAIGEELAVLRRSRGDFVDLVFTERSKHAIEIAHDSKSIDRIAVVGGDGTLRESVEGLGPRCLATPIALIPLGHGNVIAREFGISITDPWTAAAALDLPDESCARLDIGLANEQPFLAMVGVGFDSFPTRFVRAARGTRLGRLVYSYGPGAHLLYGLGGVAGLFRLFPSSFAIEVSGISVSLRFPTVTVCNTRTYATGWSVAPNAVPDDGEFEIVGQRFAFLPIQLLALLFHKLKREMPRELAAYYAGESVRLSAEGPFHWQLDGDAMATTSALDISMAGYQARLLRPAR